MNKTTKEVPAGIRYVSDWIDFSLRDFTRPTIVNKQITGCGFTEYCLRNEENVILCSPRVILLENKTEQHEKEDNILYVKNKIEKSVFMDKNLNKMSTYKEEKEEDQEVKKSNVLTLKNSIKSHYNHCIAAALFSEEKKAKPCKILVTYDSFRHVKEALGDNIKNFYVVIDEFQSIFVDSKFKSTTEMEFVDQIQGLDKVIYLSATPMLDNYLELLDEFKDLDYVEFDWGAKDSSRVIKPVLDVHTSRSIITDAKKVIEDYKTGNFEKAGVFDEDGKLTGEIVSNEAVIYVNSVKNIGDIISGCQLMPSEVNVLCSRSTENERFIKAAFNRVGTALAKEIEDNDKITDATKKKEMIKDVKSRYKTDNPIGKVPKKGDKHKMFTLCTRTVYLGADFYSPCARSFIFSDANIDCLCVDITLDLPQILGRQRLETNPWKNYATLYFKPIGKDKEKTQEMFNKYRDRKLNNTKSLLRTWNGALVEDKGPLAGTYKIVAECNNYKNDYVAVNCHAGSDLLPVFNNLVVVAEMRAFDIQQYDYKDRFSVFSTLRDKNEITNERVNEIVEKVDPKSKGFFTAKMKLICENDLTPEEQNLLINSISPTFRNFYNVLGPERCKALHYQFGNLQKEYDRLIVDTTDEVSSEIYSIFREKESYTLVYIKEKLKEIYQNHSYKKTPKAPDILNYFEAAETKITDKSTGKRSKGYKLLIKKK